MIFSWDQKKAAANLKKHGVDFHEAVTVLADPLAVTSPDPDHSEDEDRFVTLGESATGHRLILVVHSESSDITRIISARPATPFEKRYYEEGE